MIGKRGTGYPVLVVALCALLTACAGQLTTTDETASTTEAGLTPVTFPELQDVEAIKRARTAMLYSPELGQRLEQYYVAEAELLEHWFQDDDWSATVEPALDALRVDPLALYPHYALMHHYSANADLAAAAEHERMLALIGQAILGSGAGTEIAPYRVTTLNQSYGLVLLAQYELWGSKFSIDPEGYLRVTTLVSKGHDRMLEELHFRIEAPTLAMRQAGVTETAALLQSVVGWMGEFAEAGDDAAQVFMAGYLYSYVPPDQRDPDAARAYLAAARDYGNLYADYHYALMLTGELGALSEGERQAAFEEAAGIYFELAVAGFPRVYRDLVALYGLLPQGPDGVAELVQFLRKASESGNGNASMALVDLYWLGHALDRDMEASLNYLEVAAGQGVLNAKARYADYVLRSSITHGHLRDRGVSYLSDAVSAGDPGALYVAYALNFYGIYDIGDAGAFQLALLAALEETNDLDALGPLLWILATASEPVLQDPGQAIETSNRILANINSSLADPGFLYVVATAHAQASDYATAVNYLRKANFALQSLPDAMGRQEHEARLEVAMAAYSKHEPLPREELDFYY